MSRDTPHANDRRKRFQDPAPVPAKASKKAAVKKTAAKPRKKAAK